MTDPRSLDLLVQQFGGLAESLLDATTVSDTLQQIIQAAVQVVPGADLSSVTLRDLDGTFYTPVETDPVATRLDQIQYETGEGPCLEAAREPGPALAFSADLAAEEKWPRFGPAAAERGMLSVVSTALLPYSRPSKLSGALNIYSRRRGGLDQADHNIAFLLATYASLALATTQAVVLAELQVAQLHKALDTRDVIGQAKGILMSRRGVTADEAFDILRRASQELNVRLTEIARTLVDRRVDLDRVDSG